jgi:hypothetical protein
MNGMSRNMDDLKLIVPLDKLRVSGTSPKVHGAIYFQTEKTTFPDDLWDDFVAVILSWWIYNLATVHINVEAEFKFLFMDGPVEVRGRYEDDICKLTFVRRYSNAEDIFDEVTVVYDDLMTCLINVARSVVKFAGEKDWETGDIISLGKTVTKYADGLESNS